MVRLETPRKVHVQGHPQDLFVYHYASGCGDIKDGDGVAFRFGDHGGWVIPLEELRAIVREADEIRGTDLTHDLRVTINFKAVEQIAAKNPAAHDAWQLALQHIEPLRAAIERARKAEGK